MEYQWDFSGIVEYWPALLSGVGTTLALTTIIIGFGTPLGFLLAIPLLARAVVIRVPAIIIVDMIRSLPALILILWVYYLVPVLLGQPRMSSFVLAAIALIFNLAAFVADVVRASYSAFPRGLLDAAYSCGLSHTRAVRYVVIPTMLRELLPVLGLLYIDMLKLTSLASVVAVYEILHTADRIRSQTFRPLEIFSIVAIIYLVLVMPFSFVVRRMERSPRFRRDV